MTLLGFLGTRNVQIAAAIPPPAAAEPAPPGGPAAAPGPAPAWDHHSSFRGGAWNSKPRAGVILGDGDADRGFVEYLRRTQPT